MLTLSEQLDTAPTGGGVHVVFEAVALCLPAGGVVGKVLTLLTRPGGLLLEALVQGRPVISLPLLATVAPSPSCLRVQIKQFASVTRTLCTIVLIYPRVHITVYT